MDDPEFEMLINVMKAQIHVRNAEGWAPKDPVTRGRLMDAKIMLQAIVDDCGEENQRLASMQVNG